MKAQKATQMTIKAAKRNLRDSDKAALRTSS